MSNVAAAILVEVYSNGEVSVRDLAFYEVHRADNPATHVGDCSAAADVAMRIVRALNASEDGGE